MSFKKLKAESTNDNHRIPPPPNNRMPLQNGWLETILSFWGRAVELQECIEMKWYFNMPILDYNICHTYITYDISQHIRPPTICWSQIWPVPGRYVNCFSAHPSIHPSIRPSVRPSIHPSIHPSISSPSWIRGIYPPWNSHSNWTWAIPKGN